jgi:hypothetical protein
MKLFIVIFFLHSLLFAQNLERDYEILAKYSILKYSIDKYFNTEVDSLFLRNAIEETEEIVQTNNYKYEVDSIFEINNFQVISIIDHSNFQLHGLNYEVYAIDKSAEYNSRYYKISSENMIDFINKTLIITGKNKFKDESDQIKLIEFYNSLLIYLSKYLYTIEFYSEKNKEMFSYLEDSFLFKNIMKKENNYFQHLYYKRGSDNDASEIEYYSIIYSFDQNELKVEKHLLYRIKI